jgi:hypothetical protein
MTFARNVSDLKYACGLPGPYLLHRPTTTVAFILADEKARATLGSECRGGAIVTRNEPLTRNRLTNDTALVCYSQIREIEGCIEPYKDHFFRNRITLSWS